MRCAGIVAMVGIVASGAGARADDVIRHASIEAELTQAYSAGPAGWLAFCSREPAPCEAAQGAPRIALDARGRALLATVLREVRAAIRAEAEPPGRNEWRIAPAAGDCEDMALTLRTRLEAAGWPAASLRLGLAQTESAEPHVLLLVETDRGTLALDSRFGRPLWWHELERIGYGLLAVERRDGSWRWQLARPAPA